MTSTARTDIHSPTNMDPADYEYVFAFDPQSHDLRGVMSTEKGRAWWAEIHAHMAPNAHSGQCTHCGAYIRYHAILRYIPTGEHIYCGETCLDNRFSLESKQQFDALRKAAELDRAQQRIVKAAAECLESLTLTAEAGAFLADKKGASDPERISYIATDIRRKLYLYGSISQKQADFVAKLVAEVAPAIVAAKDAAKAEKDANAELPPTGRVTVTGTVLSTKWQDSDFGGSLKMLVDVGTYRLWGSVPSKLSVDKGDRITFSADVSPKEAGFGFFKRPTQASVLSEVA